MDYALCSVEKNSEILSQELSLNPDIWLITCCVMTVIIVVQYVAIYCMSEL